MLGGGGVKGHDVINYNLWAGKNLHDSTCGNLDRQQIIMAKLKQTTPFGNILH